MVDQSPTGDREHPAPEAFLVAVEAVEARRDRQPHVGCDVFGVALLVGSQVAKQSGLDPSEQPVCGMLVPPSNRGQEIAECDVLGVRRGLVHLFVSAGS